MHICIDGYLCPKEERGFPVFINNNYHFYANPLPPHITILALKLIVLTPQGLNNRRHTFFALKYYHFLVNFSQE